MPSGPSYNPDLRHLHIICTNPDGDGRQLLVNISSIKSGIPYDASCLLYPRHHRSIRHASYVAYSWCKIWDSGALLDLKISRNIDVLDELDPLPFQLVIDGLQKSPSVRPGFRQYYWQNANRHAPGGVSERIAS